MQGKLQFITRQVCRAPKQVVHLYIMQTAPTDILQDKYLRLWGIPLVTLSAVLALMFFYFPDRWDLFFWFLAGSFIHVVLTWEIGRWLIWKVRIRYPGLENTVRRALLSVLSAMLVTGGINLIIKALLHQWGFKAPAMGGPSFLRSFVINLVVDLFFVILLYTVYEAIYFFEEYRKTLQKAESLKKQQAHQQLDALKNRVNPHFLFNSLTTLSALIGEDPQHAERFVDELSKVYRYLLRGGRQKNVLVGEELQFAESYAFLLRNRFEEGAFSITYPDNSKPEVKSCCEREVPALTIQNALDYLVRTQNVPLHINIDLDAGHLRISCKYNPKSLTFENSSADWQHLERLGAIQIAGPEYLNILIPINTNPLSL